MGSHRTLFYSYHDLDQSRFAEDWVAASYTVEPMLGREGQGFIFDTNALHKGHIVQNATSPRDTLVWEINTVHKGRQLRQQLANYKWKAPCS